MNRRDVLKSIPVVLASGSALAGHITPTLASIYGTEDVTARNATWRAYPEPLRHHEILDRVYRIPGTIGRTIVIRQAESREETHTSLTRQVGEAGLWLRRLPTDAHPLRIGVVGALPQRMPGYRVTAVAASEAAAILGNDQIDGVIGPSPQLGWFLGLHRGAPYFMRLPSLFIYDTWLGPSTMTTAMAESIISAERVAHRAGPLTATELASRGVQILRND